MADKYGKSEKWVQRKIDEVKVASVVRLNKQPITVVADVTFFSRTNGLCVFREPNLKKNVWWKFTAYERRDIYLLGKQHLLKNGFKIQAMVLDGKRGVREIFSGIPTQMCHFHQKQIIRRYLTNRPKLEAGAELKNLVSNLSHTSETTFANRLNEWQVKWKDFLKEKTTNPDTGRWNYTHKRLR